MADDELSRSCATLGYFLGDQVEIEVLAGHVLIDESSWIRVLEIFVGPEEESVVDLLLEDNIGELWPVLVPDFVESLLNTNDFCPGYDLTLRISGTLSVENDVSWELRVRLLESLDGLLDNCLDRVEDIVALSTVKDDDSFRPEAGKFSVESGYDSDRGLRLAIHLKTTKLNSNQHSSRWGISRPLNNPERFSKLSIHLEQDLGDYGESILLDTARELHVLRNDSLLTAQIVLDLLVDLFVFFKGDGQD